MIMIPAVALVTPDAPVAHVVQMNLATMRAPLDAAETAEFRDALAVVNAAREAADGLVWRLQGDVGDATSIRVSADPSTIANMTVWTSIDSLVDFTYRSVHRAFLRRRGEWFVPDGRTSLVWYQPAGALPTVDEGLDRFEFLGPDRHVTDACSASCPPHRLAS